MLGGIRDEEGSLTPGATEYVQGFGAEVVRLRFMVIWTGGALVDLWRLAVKTLGYSSEEYVAVAYIAYEVEAVVECLEVNVGGSQPGTARSKMIAIL